MFSQAVGIRLGGFLLEFMELTKEQYEKIAPYLPVQRGNVRISNLQMLNALLYMAENGCKWRGLPAHFGKWSTIHQRINHGAKNRVLNQVFEKLNAQRGKTRPRRFLLTARV